MAKKLIALPYYGGKFSHLNWLLPLLPDNCRHFVDVFGGSAVVILNRPASPLDTYNDLDGDVVNFFRVLRDNGDELIRRLELTPCAREEFRQSVDISDITDPIERARLLFVRLRQGVGGRVHTTPGQWGKSLTLSRRGISGFNSAWLSGVEGLSQVVDRLRTIQIENLPALDIIRLYDGPDTLFYLDPPYPDSSRHPAGLDVYSCRMTDEDHAQLAARLYTISGRAAISGYRCPLYDSLYCHWQRVDGPVKHTTVNTSGIRSERQECLWVNY